MKRFRAMPMLISLVLFAGSSISVGHACTTCASSIELSKQQLSCMETFLPSYLAETGDPVIVSLLQCSQSAADYSSKDARSDPVLNPIVDPEGDQKAADKVYFLTKKQIRCLGDNINALKKQDRQSIVFEFSACN